MDAVHNPFAPGAGSRPPELAGRSAILEDLDVRLRRLKLGRPANSIVLVGLRGVGKTVLLDTIAGQARCFDLQTVRLEAAENRPLPELLAPQIRIALLAMDRIQKAKAQAKRAFRALAAFARGFEVKFSKVGVSWQPEIGLADSGELEIDLGALLHEVGTAARAADSALAIFVDELQYVKTAELGALLGALHRCSQERSPVILIGAGLPQLRALAAEAKTYAERLLDFRDVGPLDQGSAADAISRPLEGERIQIEPPALRRIIGDTRGYPYFLQEWGRQAWNAASASPITSSDVDLAAEAALAALDESFFRVRLDRLTSLEKRYLRAMAEIGSLPARSGKVAELLGRKPEAMGPTRNSLIRKGMAWSPSYGEIDFTVPLFDGFMKRMMPGDEWKRI